MIMANSTKGKCQVCPKLVESRCSWCKLVFYCSREHQKLDWKYHKETCTKKKYRMEENEELGRHFVASEDIKADIILFKDKPLVLSYKLDALEFISTENKICVGCYKEIPLSKGNPNHHQQRKRLELDKERGEMKRAVAAPLLLLSKPSTTTTNITTSSTADGIELTSKGEQKKADTVQSENNEESIVLDDNENSQSSSVSKDQHDNRRKEDSASADDDNDADGTEDSDEDDNSEEDEDNDEEDEESNSENEENVCLNCQLPVCNQVCSEQYFHNNFECKFIREAFAHAIQLRQQHQQQQNPLSPVSRETSDEAKQRNNKSLSSLSSSHVPGRSDESNQKSSSPDTTCSLVNNTSSASKNMITTIISNGIRESLLRNLLVFRCFLLKHFNESEWEGLMNLQSGKENVASLEKATRIFNVMNKALNQINHPTINTVYKPDVLKLLGIIEINALNLSISQNVEVTGIYPTFSLLEHSCIPTVKYYPTAVMMTEGADKRDKNSSKKKSSSSSSNTFLELYCRSAVKMKKGDHLSVAYTNAMWNTEKRREFLQKEKQFWCCCKRCEDGYELGSNFSTILCPLPECKAPAVPIPIPPKTVVGSGGGGGVGAGNAPYDIQWKCTSSKCGKTCAAWQVKKVDTKLCEMVGRTKPSVQGYKECLSKMRELVHEDYYLCCIVIHSLIQMYNHNQDDATIHDKKMLEEKIAFCNKLLSIYKKLDPGLAILNIYASVVFYEMHSAILAMAGAEVDEDYFILRNNPETVNLAKVYLQKCIECFKYEFLELPENKLKLLAMKKMEYLNIVMSKR